MNVGNDERTKKYGDVESMKRALLVIDVQNEYFTGKMPVTYPAGTLPRILSCLDAARAAAVPVVLIQHSAAGDAPAFARGSRGWEIHSDVLARHHDMLIEKTLPGSFTHTSLEAYLHEQNIDTVAICGYMTQMCCDTTARQAMQLDFAVEFLSDATGTLAFSGPAGHATAEELHRVTLVTQSLRFSRVMTAAVWIAGLSQS